MKTVIVGNSGSGKSWLARRLALIGSCEVIHLDELFWEPGGFDRKRHPDAIEALIVASKEAEAWIVEGVFGELAERYLHQATLFIWLDMDWHTCKARLERRGSESKTHLGREQSEAGLKRLMDWASTYHTRSDLRSYKGHKEMYESFTGRRLHLSDEVMVSAFLHNVQHCAAGSPATRGPEPSR